MFLFMGVAFGLSTAIVNSMKYGVLYGIPAGLIGGIFFGGSMSLILGYLHKRSVKRISSDNSDVTTSVCHVRKITISKPYDKTFKLCLKSLDAINKCKVKKNEREKGIIYAKTGLNWKTFGDDITFQLTAIGDDMTEVEVTSKPALSTTIVDYGKNLDNVEKIAGFLNAIESVDV